MAEFIFNQKVYEQEANLKIKANSINKIKKANEAIQAKKGNLLRKRAASVEMMTWLHNELKEVWDD